MTTNENASNPPELSQLGQMLEQVTIRSIDDVRDAAVALNEIARERGYRAALSDDIASNEPMIDADGGILNAEIFGWMTENGGGKTIVWHSILRCPEHVGTRVKYSGVMHRVSMGIGPITIWRILICKNILQKRRQVQHILLCQCTFLLPRFLQVVFLPLIALKMI